MTTLGIPQIEYAELTDEQMAQVYVLTNETLPQGQDFFLQDGEVIAIESNLRNLFEAQNREFIEAGEIQEIV